MSTKVCAHCNEELPATTEFFYKHPTSLYGLDSRCISCRKVYDKGLKNAHKDAPPKPDCCPICGTTTRPLWLDHDRITGEILGYLCPNCNTHNGWYLRNIEAIEAYNQNPPNEIIN